jgi:hypothetical protein
MTHTNDDHKSTDRAFIATTQEDMMYRETDYNLEDAGIELRNCEECGAEAPCAFGEDPFGAEIHQDYTQRWACHNCDYQSAMDI